MTAAWLLPIVSTVVASASGGVVASVLPPEAALVTIITSYIIWGCGVPLALFTMVIYFHRLTMHALPPKEVIVSVFLPLGPLGQGSFAILQLGADALKVFDKLDTLPQAPIAGQVFFAGGVLVAFVMWGFGCVWLFFALASLRRMKRFPFNLGWWAFTFPLGVFTTATTTLAKELPSAFFKILGTVFSLIVVVLWLVVMAVTLKRGLTGKLIVSPVVKGWAEQRKEVKEMV
jgi:tellurite resistance protein TehA-like permease